MASKKKIPYRRSKALSTELMVFTKLDPHQPPHLNPAHPPSTRPPVMKCRMLLTMDRPKRKGKQARKMTQLSQLGSRWKKTKQLDPHEVAHHESHNQAKRRRRRRRRAKHEFLDPNRNSMMESPRSPGTLVFTYDEDVLT